MIRERDIRPEAQAAQLAILRRLGPARRARMAASMSEDARRIALDGIRRRRPELSDDDARLVLFELLWGKELFQRVWGKLAKR